MFLVCIANTPETDENIKNTVLWDVTPCGYCKILPFGGTYRFHRQGDEKQRAKKFVSSK
jgi:hypothetical protein